MICRNISNKYNVYLIILYFHYNIYFTGVCFIYIFSTVKLDILFWACFRFSIACNFLSVDIYLKCRYSIIFLFDHKENFLCCFALSLER